MKLDGDWRVIQSPDLLQYCRRYSIGVILDAATAVSEPVRLAFLWRPAARDPDDDMVLETAANGRADAIVTFNKRDFVTVAERFGVRVLSPGEAVKLLETRP
jgi:predicted nucleic acid-binding protein